MKILSEDETLVLIETNLIDFLNSISIDYMRFLNNLSIFSIPFQYKQSIIENTYEQLSYSMQITYLINDIPFFDIISVLSLKNLFEVSKFYTKNKKEILKQNKRYKMIRYYSDNFELKIDTDYFILILNNDITIDKFNKKHLLFNYKSIDKKELLKKLFENDINVYSLIFYLFKYIFKKDVNDKLIFSIISEAIPMNSDLALPLIRSKNIKTCDFEFKNNLMKILSSNEIITQIVETLI
jgi:hypothetical protein